MSEKRYSKKEMFEICCLRKGLKRLCCNCICQEDCERFRKYEFGKWVNQKEKVLIQTHRKKCNFNGLNVER